MGDWKDRRAAITGAASGIGRAIAQAFAAEGCSLALSDVNADALEALALELRTRGVIVETAVVDVSDADAMRAWADEVAGGGPVHLVVNNAGIGIGGEISETPPEAWDKVVGINLLGVAYGCHAFIPHLQAARGLRAIINISSASGFGGTPGLGAYAATKAAVLSLSETLEVELERDGIQVHCVTPGFVRTNIIASTELHGSAKKEGAKDKIFETRFPESRRPEGVAEAVIAAIRAHRFLVPVYAEGHGAAWTRYLPSFMRKRVRHMVLDRSRALSEG